MWNPKKEAEKAARRVVDKVVRPAADAAKRGLNSMGDQVRAGIRSVGHNVESSLKRVGNEIEGGVKRVGDEVEAGIKQVGGEVEAGVRTAGREVEDGLTEKLPELVQEELQDAIEAFAKAITSEGLRKVRASLNSAHKKMTALRDSKPGLVDAIDEVSFYVEFGPVKATYASFYSRSEGLSHVLSQPPDFKRSSIVGFFRATVPTSIDFGLSVQVVALVVGSKELGIGGGMGDIPGALAVELLDVILEAAGVPE